MTGPEFAAYRKATNISQQDLGSWLGISRRTIQRVEDQPIVEDLYVFALERAALKKALQLSKPFLVPADMRNDALELATLIRGQ